MSGTYYLTCLWPGLVEIWWRGRLTALPYAIVFSLLVNIYLVASFIYPDWLPASVAGLIFWIGVPIWILFVIRDLRNLPAIMNRVETPEACDLYKAALAQMLAKQYADAEGSLTDMLGIEPRDPPALLLLAGLYRQTQRFEAASLLLREMSRLEVSDAWWLEIDAEQRRLSRQMKAEAVSEDNHQDSSESLISVA